MKKIILTTSAVVGLAYGAFAQGSLTAVQTMFNADGIVTQGTDATDPSNPSDNYYSGNISLEVFVAPSATPAGDITAINNLDGTSSGGQAALGTLSTDGFVLASDVNPVSGTQTAGALSFSVFEGDLTPSSNPNQINLMSPAVASSTEYIAIYAVAVGGADNGWSGILAYSQAIGGNPFVAGSLPPANMTTDPTGLNLVLAPVPEPGTMALAGLGSLSLFLLRRKK